MDAVVWAIALVIGFVAPSLRVAFAGAASASIVLRLYQYFLTEPQVWRAEFPADFIGASAMVLTACLFAYIGSLVKAQMTKKEVSR